MKITPERFAELLGELDGELRKAATAELWTAVSLASALAKRNATERLRVRTGRLRSSIIGDSDGLTGFVRAGDAAVTYARIQDEGGTVKPRNGKYLTIPVGQALTGSGVERQPARAYKDLFPIRSKKGNLLLARRNGKALDVLYILVQRVKVPPTRFLTDAAEQAADSLREGLNTALAEVLRKV